MRYTITRYYKHRGGYIDPLAIAYSSLEAAVKDTQFSFILGQVNKIQLIPTTDDSLRVYVGNRNTIDIVTITREDNPFFCCGPIMNGVAQIIDKSDINDVHVDIYDALYTMFGNYLKSATTQPELF